MTYTVPCDILQEKTCNFSCSHLQRSTPDLVEGLKTVFRELCFTPKLPLNPDSNFDLESHLTWCSTQPLATASVANKSNLVRTNCLF